MGEQTSDVVAGEHLVASVGGADGDGETVGVRVVREHEVGALFATEREDEIHRAFLFGVRERDRRERAVGLGLLAHRVDAREAGVRERAPREPVAHTVERGVGDREVARDLGVHEQSAHAGEVLRFHLFIERGIEPACLCLRAREAREIRDARDATDRARRCRRRSAG